MKNLLVILTLSLAASASAQDTTFITQREDSGKVVMVTTKTDTAYLGFYKSGKLESRRTYKHNAFDGPYERYYENGKLMWLKNLVNNLEDGRCKYYNTKGGLVAELNYKKGVITDTLFLTSKETVILGRATYLTEVVGGVVRQYEEQIVKEPPDYPYMNFPFVVVNIKDEKSIPVKVASFETDQMGMFLLCLPKGNYGFFPAGYDLRKLEPGQFCPPSNMHSSGHESWNMRSPLVITKPTLIFFSLYYESIGYAP